MGRRLWIPRLRKFFQNTGMPVSQLWQLLLDSDEWARLHATTAALTAFPPILGLKFFERLCKVLGHSDVVHHVPAGLPASLSVDPRDGLKEVVRHRPFVQVEHLLDRGVEAGEKHVLHAQDRQAASLRPGLVLEHLLEVRDMGLLPGLVGPPGEHGLVVVVARDHCGNGKLAENAQVLVSLNKERVVSSCFSSSSPLAPEGRIECLQLLDQFLALFLQGPLVENGGPAGGGHHLGLEAVGQDGPHIMPQHVGGLGGDQLGGLQNVALRSVLRLMACFSSSV